MEENQEKVVLDGAEISKEQLKEKKESLDSNQKIVEVDKSNFHTLNRLKG